MEAYQLRVVEERKALSEKVAKLSEFLTRMELLEKEGKTR